MMTTVEDAIVQYMINQAGHTGDISLDANLIEDLHMDSLDVVDLTLHLEEIFTIQIDDDDEVRRMPTIRALAEYVQNKYNLQ